MKLNLGCGAFPLDGFENHDRITDGWQAVEGLGYPSRSVDAVTISHMLMYLTADEADALLAEVYRVLRIGGLVRITEDDTEHPESKRRGGMPGALLLTGPAQMRDALARAGISAVDVTPDHSAWIDDSLIQRFHGDPPLVFHIEGRRL